jgi:predicted nucleic acid-binding protein
MRLVLDTNVYSFAPEAQIERLAARGFLISVSEIALVEALAKSRRDYLSGALTKERARGRFFARAKKLEPYLDPRCPVALGLQGSRSSSHTLWD